MNLYVLFIQRSEKYPGQHAPEAMDVMDEWSFEENPDYLFDKQKKLANAADVVATRIIKVTGLDQNSIRGRLLSDKIPEEEATGMEVVE